MIVKNESRAIDLTGDKWPGFDADASAVPVQFLRLYDAWHDWFYERWRRGDGFFCGGTAVEDFVRRGEYDGFGGEF